MLLAFRKTSACEKSIVLLILKLFRSLHRKHFDLGCVGHEVTQCCSVRSSLLLLNVAPWAAAAAGSLDLARPALSSLPALPAAIRLLPPEPPTERASDRARAILQRCRRRSAPIARLAPRSLPRSLNFSYIASGYSHCSTPLFPIVSSQFATHRQHENRF